MSNGTKQRWAAAIARKVGEELVAELTPRCQQVRIAGSLRRGKPDVGDIEILYVPRSGQVHKPGELFAQPGSLADELTDRWVDAGVLIKRPNSNGSTTWGGLNKLAIHAASHMPVDLFATTTERWFVSLVVRTGSAETNIRLAGNALRRGWKLHAYGAIERADTGEQFFPTSEREVFELCGVQYLEPSAR
jgi:DNA polymerase/3'-5' exonuclease PolX